jgi:two-component system, response regulator RegA
MSANETDTRSRSILLVDDDATFLHVMARAFRRRGFTVTTSASVGAAMEFISAQRPDYAVVDLRMPDGSGLALVQRLAQCSPPVHAVVLTGYSSIATAVEAIKLGARHYLTKPAEVDEILAALERDGGDAGIVVPDQPLSVGRLEWEHLQKVLGECAGNISEAARRLGMHRRTLQRKLGKRPARR